MAASMQHIANKGSASAFFSFHERQRYLSVKSMVSK
jgi:hypothetical protein